VVGKTIVLDGTATQMIGVLPAGFETPTLTPADLLVPQRLRQGPEKQRLVRSSAGFAALEFQQYLPVRIVQPDI
jgi:hypothetical protein